MVKELITKVHQVLNEVKDFEVNYSTKNMDRGYILIKYKGKIYAVRAVEFEPADDLVPAVEKTQYWV